jgi:hypothetical protein
VHQASNSDVFVALLVRQASNWLFVAFLVRRASNLSFLVLLLRQLVNSLFFARVEGAVLVHRGVARRVLFLGGRRSVLALGHVDSVLCGDGVVMIWA